MWLKNVTFSENDVSHSSVGAGGGFLHGPEGAPLSDLLDLSLRQAEAKEAADVTDRHAEVLQDVKQKQSLCGLLILERSHVESQLLFYLLEFFIGDNHDVGVVHFLLPGQGMVKV